MTPIGISRQEAQRWTRRFFRPYRPWQFLGGVLAVLAMEFTFILLVL